MSQNNDQSSNTSPVAPKVTPPPQRARESHLRLVMQIVFVSSKFFTNEVLNESFARLGEPTIVKVSRKDYLISRISAVIQHYTGLRLITIEGTTTPLILKLDMEDGSKQYSIYVSASHHMNAHFLDTLHQLLLEGVITYYGEGTLGVHNDFFEKRSLPTEVVKPPRPEVEKTAKKQVKHPETVSDIEEDEE